MTLWLILGLMTAAAIFAVIWPLARHGTAARSGGDIAVYRDQLDEIERDLAAGLIGKTEAEAARVEISRRLLAAADAAQATTVSSTPAAIARRRRAVALLSLFLLPAGAGSLYLRLGSPELAFPAIAAEQDVSPGQQPSIEILVARAEAHLQRNPTDGRGWEVLAPVYMRLGRYTDSVQAWRNTLQLLGEDANREANLGEALVAEANGTVTADANAAFVRAVKLNGTIISARYYLAIAAEQDGKRNEAAKIFRDLITEAPPGAHWLNDVRAALARVEGKTPTMPTGPTPAQSAAAAKRMPEQQAAMIRGMVESLAARLKKDGSDLDGWVSLVRSYKVLDDPEKASAAATSAREALAENPGKRQQLDAALKELDASNSTNPGPTPAPMAATVNQSPEQQAAMIHRMVDRLAARLRQDSSDLDGWVRLVRSYKVLGEPDKANAAAAEARQAFTGDPNKMQQLDASLKALESGDTTAGAPSHDTKSMTDVGAPPNHQQGETMQRMVERLAERLKSAPDPQGWLILTRSYLTLGEKEKATAAIKDGRRTLADEPGKLAQFNDALKQFNINE